MFFSVAISSFSFDVASFSSLVYIYVLWYDDDDIWVGSSRHVVGFSFEVMNGGL